MVGCYTSQRWLHKQTTLIFSYWIVLNKSNYFCIDLLKFLRRTVHIFSIFKMDGWVQILPKAKYELLWQETSTLAMSIVLWWLIYRQCVTPSSEFITEKGKRQKIEKKTVVVIVHHIGGFTNRQTLSSTVENFWTRKNTLPSTSWSNWKCLLCILNPPRRREQSIFLIIPCQCHCYFRRSCL